MRGLISLIVIVPIFLVFGAYLLPVVGLVMLVSIFSGGNPVKNRQPKW